MSSSINIVKAAALAVGFLSVNVNADCDLYVESEYNQCGSCSSSCFNAGSRGGVLCEGAGTGYHCPAEGGSELGTAFACMDWSFGSQTMQEAEQQFAERTDEDVFLGVGTFGYSDDEQRGLGACYRITVEGVEKDIIAQSINTGGDVAGNQFDLQMGAGGAGMFNTCAGDDGAMYAGGKEAWGCVYGGIDSKAECKNLPKFPKKAGRMKAAGDSLVELCEYSFEKGVRSTAPKGKPELKCKLNPTISDLSRVKCPDELVEITQMQRIDEPKNYKSTPKHRPEGFPNTDYKCSTEIMGTTPEYCLTRMMDCRKPSGAFKDNVLPDLMVKGKKLVQTCLGDGYTRIDNSCGCMNCYC